MHIATGGDERPVVLEQVRLTEAHACNHSPFVVLEDAHTPEEPGWLMRAYRARTIHELRREAMAPEGYALGELPPLGDLGDPLAVFGVTLEQCLAAQASVPELAGLVVVLAPGVLEDAEALVIALLRLMSVDSLASVRFIVLELGSSAVPFLMRAFGSQAVMASTCIADAGEPEDPASAPAKRDQRALLAAAARAPVGASPEVRAGYAGAKDVVAPTRAGQPPRDAPLAPEVQEQLARDLGPETALAGPLGAEVKRDILGAALAMQEQRYPDAIRMQAGACERCLGAGMAKLGAVLAITLATYRLHAGDSEGAIAGLGATVARASEDQMFDVLAQAHLALAAAFASSGAQVDSAVHYVLAGEAAEKAEAGLLAVEAYRLAGQLALAAGAEDVAVASWHAGLEVASGLPAEAARGSSAPLSARSLAKVYLARGDRASAATMLARAEVFEAGVAPGDGASPPKPGPAQSSEGGSLDARQ